MSPTLDREPSTAFGGMNIMWSTSSEHVVKSELSGAAAAAAADSDQQIEPSEINRNNAMCDQV